MKIIITGPIPSKKNSRITVCRGKYPISLPSKKYAEWHEEWGLRLLPQRPKQPLQRCKIEIRYWPPNKRKADMDNRSASILDLLKDIGYILDDNWFAVVELNQKMVELSSSNPRAEIWLEELH